MVPVTTGELHIFDGKTTVPAPLRAGVSYARQIGVEHDVINPNSFEFVFVEIELKPSRRARAAGTRRSRAGGLH